MTDDLVCAECGFPIAVRQKYMKHDRTGKVLCIDCFEKLQKEGKIE